MKKLLIAAVAIVALSTSAAFAKGTHPDRANRIELKKHADKRADKARQQVAADLHRRGSNIPPAFSADGRWAR